MQPVCDATFARFRGNLSRFGAGTSLCLVREALFGGARWKEPAVKEPTVKEAAVKSKGRKPEERNQGGGNAEGTRRFCLRTNFSHSRMM